jgi:hypothetical protein
MFVPPFVLPISRLNPDFILTNIDREGSQVVAFVIETSSALQIEAPAVPIAGQDAVPHRTTGQGIAHMGALVVSGIDPSIDVKQRDATPISQPDSFRFTSWNIAERCHLYPL